MFPQAVFHGRLKPSLGIPFRKVRPFVELLLAPADAQKKLGVSTLAEMDVQGIRVMPFSSTCRAACGVPCRGPEASLACPEGGSPWPRGTPPRSCPDVQLTGIVESRMGAGEADLAARMDLISLPVRTSPFPGVHHVIIVPGLPVSGGDPLLRVHSVAFPRPRI